MHIKSPNRITDYWRKNGTKRLKVKIVLDYQRYQGSNKILIYTCNRIKGSIAQESLNNTYTGLYAGLKVYKSL